MDCQIFKDYPMLRPISLDALEESQYSETSIQSLVKLRENAALKYELLLSGELILLCSAQSGLSNPFAYVRIGPHLKFQKIHTFQGISKPIIAGFRLLDDFNQEVTFFIDFPELAAMWVDALGKLINQVGFHKQFKPIRTLGKGSSATVYEILRLSDGKRFAAKTFSKETVKSNPQKLKSFINELEILRNLNHKHLLKVEGVYQTDTSYYVLMETLNGGNLLEYLVKRKKGLTIDQIKQLMHAILLGLEELDSNDIIHRDIKLENLMLRNKNSLEPVIVDFGLAVYSDDDDYVYYQCGTPGYLSPEILKLQKGETLQPTCDIFSAGVVMHVLLTGKYLFEGKEAAVVFANNKSLTFDLNKPQYELIDKAAMDLLKKMLSTNAQTRISASDCLHHEFLRSFQIPQQLSIVSPATTIESYTF